ncbi:hypothetical protein [Stutzerimonas stutzeri]|uniref:hypothetical protein n=1 Tax=Stutzerimonas stutzeri TaxID=316 RepID=UPI00101AE42C|nr:hypothetical protein [Stutzerimonas stutzeri]
MAGLKQLNWASEGVGATAAALVDLSTVAGNKISNPPWVKFQSAGWVNFPSAPTFPQLALFLCHIRARLPESTPLYYLFDLLPDIHMTEYDCAKNTRNAVRQQLDKITEANTADFRSSLNKITTKSDIKLKTIEDKIGKLNQNFSSRDCKEELPDKVKNVRAAYIAGTAIQRFIGHLSNGTPDIHSASLLGILKYYINEFTNQAQKKTQDNFHQSHIILHHDMIGSSNCFPEPDLDTSIMEIFNCYERFVATRTIEECAPLAYALEIIDRAASDTTPVREAIALLEQDKDFEIFKPVHHYLKARLQIIEGDNTSALLNLKDILNCSKKQQLGEIAVIAASYAITLELKKPGRWINNSLDPFIICLAQNKQQNVSIEIPMPTPFWTFSKNPQVTDSTKLVFEAISLINSITLQNATSTTDELCNPLSKLEKHLSKLLKIHRKLCQSVAFDEESIKTATSTTFNNSLKSKSILRTHHAKPYEVIRDLYFYINEFFGQAEIEIHEKLNPAILEYLNLPPQLQLTILKTLDEDAFRSDSNKAGNNQI